MNTFEDHLTKIYNIYVNTTNITDLRYIKHSLNIPNMAGARSIHIETVHNAYEFDHDKRNRYKLLNGYAQWTRFNQLHLDDTIRLNKTQVIKSILSDNQTTSNTIKLLKSGLYTIKTELDNMKMKNNDLTVEIQIYEEQTKSFIHKYNVFEIQTNTLYKNMYESIWGHDMVIWLLCIVVCIILYVQLL